MSDYFSEEAVKHIESTISRLESFEMPEFADYPQISEDIREMVGAMMERLVLLRDKLNNEESMYEVDQ